MGGWVGLPEVGPAEEVLSKDEGVGEALEWVGGWVGGRSTVARSNRLLLFYKVPVGGWVEVPEVGPAEEVFGEDGGVGETLERGVQEAGVA